MLVLGISRRIWAYLIVGSHDPSWWPTMEDMRSVTGLCNSKLILTNPAQYQTAVGVLWAGYGRCSLWKSLGLLACMSLKGLQVEVSKAPQQHPKHIAFSNTDFYYSKRLPVKGLVPRKTAESDEDRPLRSYSLLLCFGSTRYRHLMADKDS